jgi:hypothetical protein
MKTELNWVKTSERLPEHAGRYLVDHAGCVQEALYTDSPPSWFFASVYKSVPALFVVSWAAFPPSATQRPNYREVAARIWAMETDGSLVPGPRPYVEGEAPKDGTWMIAWWGVSGGPFASLYTAEYRQWARAGYENKSENPTHWMPMPKVTKEVK